MSNPKRLMLPTGPFNWQAPAQPRQFWCGYPKDTANREAGTCNEPCEAFVGRDSSLVCSTAFCKLHGELTYSSEWQRRIELAKDSPDGRMRLLAERQRWLNRGHVWRGTSEREYIDGNGRGSGAAG